MSDRIETAISDDGFIKAIAISSRETAERARKIHNLSKVATAALGRTLSAAAMMGYSLKTDKGSVTIQINGGGQLGTIVAVSDNEGNPRGYVQHPDIELPLRPDGKLDVGGAVGRDGFLTVIKDIGLKEPYTGKVSLESGEIAGDITSYLYTSEQTPSVCALGVLVDRDYSVKASGGFIIGLLPGAGEDVISAVETGLNGLPAVTELLDGGLSPYEMLCEALPLFTLKKLDNREVGYKCNCSRERVLRALISLGSAELLDMAAEEKDSELTCQFCDKVYTFTPQELRDIADSGKNSDSNL